LSSALLQRPAAARLANDRSLMMNSILKTVTAATLAGAALVAFAPPQLATAATALAAATQSSDHTLTVHVVYPANTAGEVWVGLYDGPESFDAGDEIRSARIPANQDDLHTVFEGLPAGEYGIIAFHDSNSDGDFNRNFMGIPSERYGFSNNPAPRFRAATWSEARFTISEDGEVELTIELMGAMG
jgi:uncharacterized protein (DUF2141 family)